MLDYRIITKDDYKRIRLNKLNNYSINKDTVKRIVKDWDDIRNNYNFIIAVGQEGREMFYSVDYFSDNIVSNKVNLGDYTVTLGCL